MGSTAGRRIVVPLTNKSGGAVAAGDVVVGDAANDDAFTTSAAGAVTSSVGVALEAIANNGVGRVAFGGYVPLVNVNASVTRGNFGKTHTVVKQATDAGSSRTTGTFCQFLKAGTTPSAMLFGYPDSAAGGAGAPTTGTYLTGAAEGSLSAEKVRADLYKNYDPDNYPTSGTTFVDEFDDSSLDGAWTWDTAPGGTVSESVYPGFLNIIGGTNNAAAERLLRRAFVPGASTAFSAAMKGRLAIANGNFAATLALYILSSADAVISGVYVTTDGTSTGAKGHRMFGLAGASTQWPAASPIVVPLAGSGVFYFLITRSAADVYDCYWSLDGMTWQWMGTHTTSTTVSKVAIVHGGDTDAAYIEANIDFVRTFTSVTRKIGA